MPPKPTAFRTASLAVSDALSAVKAMQLEFALCYAALLVNALLSKPYLAKSSKSVSGFSALAFGVASALVIAAVIAPLAVLIHRRIILGETGGLLSLPALRDRIAEFYVASVVLQFAIVLAGIAMAVVTVGGLGVAGFFLLLIGLGVMIYLSMRLFLLFPTIAVDGPFKSLASAFRRSDGLIWPTFAAGLMLTIPATVLEKLAVLLARAVSRQFADVVATCGGAALDLLLTAAVVAIASRFYVWRLDADGPPSATGDGRLFPATEAANGS